MAGLEKRRFSRVPFDAEARIMGAHGNWLTQLLDISLKGALLAKPEAWATQPGGPFAITIKLDDNVAEIHLDADLVHERDDVIGFQTNHIDVESMTHLRRLVELNLGQEELLNRELSSLVESWARQSA